MPCFGRSTHPASVAPGRYSRLAGHDCRTPRARHVACASHAAAVRISTATLLFGLAVVVRLLVGLALLRGGAAHFVLASDDGDAYVASARWLSAGEPIVLTSRLAAKWTSEGADPAARWPAG